MPVVAFDSKEFQRRSKAGGEFYTPLGVGVWFREGKDFPNAFRMETRKLAKSFRLTDLAEVRSANHLKYGVDLRKAVPFCDQLVQSLQKYIRGIHVSYVILPPTKYPEVEVGGIGCPVERLRTAKFLRILSPMFSYIAAWSFLGSPGGVSDWELHVDGFESKQTESWEDVTRRTTPKVFPHGDECNPYINLADIIAFLTNIKLSSSREHRELRPDNVKAVWESYSFQREVRFLDERLIDKIKWRTKEAIDAGPYLARPMVFLLLDDILRGRSSTEARTSSESSKLADEPAYLSGVVPTASKSRRFIDIFKTTTPYQAVANFAFSEGGAFQLFDRLSDQNKIRDGDVLAYAGSEAKKLAETYVDMYNVRVMSITQIKEELEKHKVVS